MSRLLGWVKSDPMAVGLSVLFYAMTILVLILFPIVDKQRDRDEERFCILFEQEFPELKGADFREMDVSKAEYSGEVALVCRGQYYPINNEEFQKLALSVHPRTISSEALLSQEDGNHIAAFTFAVGTMMLLYSYAIYMRDTKKEQLKEPA